MNYHKKTAVFALSLLMCINASPLFSYAENEEATDYDDEIMPISLDDDSTATTDGFSYTVDTEGNAHITGCVLTDTEITVPETLDGITVTEIDSKAFMDGTAVKIHIPATIEYISAENPFAPCLELIEITVDEQNENYCAVDGVLFTKDMKKLVCYPAKKSGTSYTIPDGVEQLGIASVAETGLKEIIVPDSVNEIDRHAFSFNEKLEKIDLSGTSVETLDTMAFINCTSLNEVLLPETLTEIGLAVFFGCENLAEITLPSQLIVIGQSSFAGTSMMSVRIPDSVTFIGYCAFGYDTEENMIKDFTIIGTAGSAAHTYATDTDEEYDIQNDFNFITSETADAEEEYLAMNPVTSSDGEYEYSVLDDGTCSILFCVSMDSSITVPSEIDGYTVTEIFRGAFMANEATEIILPDTVKTIGEAVFSEYVEKITLPASCTEISGTEPFLSCLSLKEITVPDGGDGAYSSLDGVLYNKDKSVLVAYPVQKSDTSYKAPASLKEIEMSGFCYNEFIEEVDISGVEKIGSYAFEACPSLKSVKLSKDLNTVGTNAFMGCTSLMSVRIYDKVETIGDYAFGYAYDAILAQSIANGETTETEPYSVIDGFKLYVDEDSLAYQYADFCGIEVVTNTSEIGGKNVDKNFIYVICGAVGAVIVAVIGIFTDKSISKKKKTKKKEGKK
ncbi:MAG: leucine-rich repeat domain-containing protein [Ruminococcus flavefaciens]|nr:leucine-rich repeat domain-containing protein [Ruminococcus flavefaciens]MCM1229478.1 leucine-rich repeat domain-containing protein [Ruminococcus flavefaciens]